MLNYIALFLALLPWPLFAESSVWRISKGEQSLYLGGTCQLLRPSDYPLPPELELAYVLADSLIFEVDPSLASDSNFADEFQKSALYTDGRSLDTILPESLYDKLAEQCMKSGLSVETLNKTKPGMLITMLMVRELAKFGVSEKGVAAYFYERGLRDNKKILALDTPDFQIELIDSLSDGMEDQIISYGLESIIDLQIHKASLLH